jgi:uncharacterized protein (DUF58 family)
VKASLDKLVALGRSLVSRSTGQTDVVDTHAPLLDSDELAQLVRRIRIQQGLPYSRESYHRQAGDFRSAYLGSGLDFEEARPYQSGDDVRGMDWRTTARTTKPHIKVYRETHQPVLHVVIDRGPSMRFGTRTRLKVTQAARVAAILGLGAARANTCIGATIWQPDTVTLTCRNGAVGAQQLIQAVIAPCPPLIDPGAAMMPLPVLLDRLDRQLPRGSNVVLISDFHKRRVDQRFSYAGRSRYACAATPRQPPPDSGYSSAGRDRANFAQYRLGCISGCECFHP